MYPDQGETDPFWDDLLSRTIEEPPDEGSGQFVFIEHREDLCGTLDSRSERARITRTQTAGCSITAPGGQMIYHSGTPGGPDFESVGGAAVGHSFASSQVESLLERAIVETKTLHPSAMVNVRLIGFEQRIRVIRPGGIEMSDRRQGCRVRLEAGTEGRGGIAALAEAVLPPDLDGASQLARQLAAEVIESLARRARARDGAPGERAVVFAPGVGGMLIHEIVGHALESDTYHGGLSWLSGLGRDSRVGPPDVRVIDDPRRGRGAWRFDDRGEPAIPTSLLREGRVAGCLESLDSAARSGTRPTGHGRCASYRRSVIPRMGCTFLAAGRLHAEEVLDGIGDGVYVRRMESASTDTRSGLAVFRVTDADRIRGGRIEDPLRPHLLRVQAPRALSSLDRIADDLVFDRCIGSCVRDGQPLVTSVGAPTFRIGLATVFY